MRITITIQHTGDQAEDHESDLLSLEVYPDMTVDTLRSSIQAETSFQPAAQHLYHNGHLLTDNSKTLSDLQVVDGDMLALHIRDVRANTNAPSQSRQSQRGGTRAQGGGQDPELIRLQFMGNPDLRAQLVANRPELAAALEDPQRFAAVWSQVHNAEEQERIRRQEEIRRLNSDPFDVEAQAKIEEIIRQEQVMENLRNALDHNPEVFGTVHMLYLAVEVNGHKVKALVDSGAQATIMSPTCAEQCGIMRLVDRRFAGIARGVGTATIIGRVHTAPIKIGELHLPCSFTVMEGKNVELLLGLDMLKRYQASIDLAKDKLIIQGHEIPFLGEADIPKETEQAYQDEPHIPGPVGTSIGQRTGAVTAPAPGQAANTEGSAPPSVRPGAGPSASSAPPRPRFPQEHINQLVALGATEQKAIQALEATGGNIEYAASLIFDL